MKGREVGLVLYNCGRSSYSSKHRSIKTFNANFRNLTDLLSLARRCGEPLLSGLTASASSHRPSWFLWKPSASSTAARRPGKSFHWDFFCKTRPEDGGFVAYQSGSRRPLALFFVKAVVTRIVERLVEPNSKSGSEALWRQVIQSFREELNKKTENGFIKRQLWKDVHHRKKRQTSAMEFSKNVKS